MSIKITIIVLYLVMEKDNIISQFLSALVKNWNNINDNSTVQVYDIGISEPFSTNSTVDMSNTFSLDTHDAQVVEQTDLQRRGIRVSRRRRNGKWVRF